jgi:TPR repeat protein
MRAVIFLFLLALPGPALAQSDVAAELADMAQRPCTNPPRPAEVAEPAAPNLAVGAAAARNRDFALALANLRPLAEGGDVNAQRALGQVLIVSCTGVQDQAAGVAWLTKAAAAGNIPAEMLLASIYTIGFGVPQDIPKGFTLFSHAAGAGNAVAQMAIGSMYFEGVGVSQDKFQGVQWTVKAAEQGNAMALGHIAEIYIKGEVVKRDVDEAGFFLALANQRATSADRKPLVETSQQIRAAISVEDLESAVKRARHWKPGPGSLSDVLSDAEDFRRKHE